MKQRGVFDLLRRGLDNTLANWQVSLIRFLEAFLFLAIAAGAVLAILAPVFISAGIHLTDLDTPEDFESVIALLATKWVLLIWIFVAITVLLIVFVLIHSFVEAGCARVLADGDRVAGPEILGPRTRYRTFSMQRWMSGARSGWWTVFWIYNAVWAVAGLLMLIPLLPTLAAVLLLQDNPGGAVAAGCFGLLVSGLFMILVTIVAALWSNRAIVNWAVHHTGANDSMGIAWQAIKTDLGRHVLTALAILVVGMAGSMFFSSLGFFAGMGEAFGNETFLVMTLPVRLAGSLLNSAFSALLGSWYLATYAALALDPVRR